jgi:hypothetical protein
MVCFSNNNQLGKSSMKTKSVTTGMIAAALLAVMMPLTAKAQNKVEASVGADLVSSYVWRGQDLGGVSIQPGASVAYKGFSLAAWGSVGLESADAKEFDLTLGYSTGGFSFSVTDYWFNTGSGYFQYGAHRTKHVFELQAGYDFGLLAANWYTNFAGDDGVKADGQRAYSSYFSVSAPFKLGGIEWTAEVGLVPWETTFYNGYTGGFAVTDLSLAAAKEIKVTESFSLPLSGKISINPRTDKAYFVVGLSF